VRNRPCEHSTMTSNAQCRQHSQHATGSTCPPAVSAASVPGVVGRIAPFATPVATQTHCEKLRALRIQSARRQGEHAWGGVHPAAARMTCSSKRLRWQGAAARMLTHRGSLGLLGLARRFRRDAPKGAAHLFALGTEQRHKGFSVCHSPLAFARSSAITCKCSSDKRRHADDRSPPTATTQRRSSVGQAQRRRYSVILLYRRCPTSKKRHAERSSLATRAIRTRTNGRHQANTQQN
jgi:hypothetical protein